MKIRDGFIIIAVGMSILMPISFTLFSSTLLPNMPLTVLLFGIFITSLVIGIVSYFATRLR